MIRNRGLPVLGSLVLALLGLIMLLGGLSAETSGTVSGMVVNPSGPVAGARVRVRATDNLTFTATDGSFQLSGLLDGEGVEIAAWSDGYYIASAHVTPTVTGVTMTLRPYHQQDHPDYQWISPISGTSDTACGFCHPMVMNQWISNAHGTAVSNPRFFSLYNGTDLTGTVPITPGYVSDFDGTAGNCANCHAPGLGVDGFLTTDMNAARGVITAGIHCDYCHKVGGVYLNPGTNSVYANAPGVQSQRVLRPPEGDQIFFGPYDDIHDPDTYLPVISESQFCAPCHQFSMWGTPIYESYNEWLESPYAQQGVTCQDCHMVPNGDLYFARPEEGGLPHPPEEIPSHLQLGATDTDLLQNTVSMTLSVGQELDRLDVTVTITNATAGHHVPTDYPGRHLILWITATDSLGQELVQIDGSMVPEWGGAQAGKPGKTYAKVLQDVESGEMPVVNYWKQTLIVADNRIPALESDVSRYIFTSPNSGGPITVTAQLRFRRVIADVMEVRGWDRPDVVMIVTQTVVESQPHWSTFLPFVSAR